MCRNHLFGRKELYQLDYLWLKNKVYKNIVLPRPVQVNLSVWAVRVCEHRTSSWSVGWGGVMWDMGCYGTRWGKSGQGWYLNIARSLQAAVFVMKIAISPSNTLSWKASKNMVLHSMKGIQIFLSHNAPPHVKNRYVFLSFEFLIFWIGLRKSLL